jgi:AraC-like DNA-binding protein
MLHKGGYKLSGYVNLRGLTCSGRKLKHEGITFLEIVDAVTMDLAVTYLESGNYAMKDIAFTLGYNEPTAFVHAFKRWTGKTPVAYKTTIQTEK